MALVIWGSQRKMKSKKLVKKVLGVRIVITSIVLLIIMCVTLFAVFIYHICDKFNLLSNGSLSPFVIFILMVLISNFIGTIIASIVISVVTKPIEEAILAIEKLSLGDYNIKLKVNKFSVNIKELQKAINKTAKEMNSVELMRNDFINTISHEFKTPVQSITGYAKRLKNKELTEVQRDEYIDVIIENSHHLSSMTTNILMLSKFENTQIIVDKDNFYIDEQIRRCFQHFQNEWIAKNIEIEGNMNHVLFYGNEELMQHIWTNLISNAINHTNENGKIFCNVIENDANVCVQIGDNGCGMDEETKLHLFDKFYQSEKSKKFGGNGLGMSIVKRLVDLCDGSITFESELGKGTVFYITLPNQYK